MEHRETIEALQREIRVHSSLEELQFDEQLRMVERFRSESTCYALRLKLLIEKLLVGSLLANPEIFGQTSREEEMDSSK